MLTPMIKSIELPDRIALSYVEQGDRSGIPVLLLHGVTDSWYSYQPVLPHLPPSMHVFALTQRGHGDSSRPVSGYRFDDFASDLAAFMDALEIESAVIVGHSMGSSVAQRFAIDYPERTVGLVLVGSFVNFRSNPDVRALWDSAISTLTDPVDPDFIRDFQQSTLAQPMSPTFFVGVITESLKVPAHVWRAAFAGFLAEDFSDEIKQIAAPTLVIWGDRDTFCPWSEQESLMAAIAGSQSIVYQDAGHALHWEQPDRFASDLVSFTETLSQRSLVCK
jgi:non-heme chloroperoxidase